ncbi:MAG TPA: 7-cyano-7-deazaguanine synthase QueC [Bdellovibrionales bacterium]|nr:7-cyano-7-deazaguanine synthase QueC [Pseudobdellovibrionaceae bacterium]HAG91988.1 7-cyano-7-deazaguanine synthase QueC [Bdellovibrionales bacterium]
MVRNEKNNAVILLSSGLDSSVNLVRALEDFDVVLALTFDYGQMAAVKEMESAKALCETYKIPHREVDLKWFSEFSESALNQKKALPLKETLNISDLETSKSSAKSVWVPNRNGIFLNIAAGYAEGMGAQVVIPGFNKEEATTFPDNSKDYIESLNHAFGFSTEGRVSVHCFTTDLEKTEIVKLGQDLNLDFSKIWPCYQSMDQWCGSCESCLRFARALGANGLSFEELQAKSGRF